MRRSSAKSSILLLIAAIVWGVSFVPQKLGMSYVEPFTYKGSLPVAKEAVVLMFADSVEAASRSLKDYSLESITDMVNRIVDGKIAEGQVAKGDITMAEIDTVKQVFIENLQQIYHGRIAYPEPLKRD